MKPLPLFPTNSLSRSLIAIVVALLFLSVNGLYAEAPATQLTIRYTGTDFEGRQKFQLEWNAISNATYLVQSAASLEPESAWKTLDIAVVPTAGTYVFDLVVTDSIGLASLPKYFRLVLPQMQIFTVEPAVVAPGVTVDLHIVGQCFSSNDVLRINGVTQSNVVFHSSTLLTKPAFTPLTPGTNIIEIISGLVRSSFTLTCADALTNPELVLQGPPEEPPASPIQALSSSSEQPQILYAEEGVEEFHLGPGIQARDACNNKIVVGGETALATPGHPLRLGVRDTCNVFKGQLRRPPAAEPRAGGLVHSVFLPTGEVREQVVDLAVQGRGLDFIWARTYNSRIGQPTSQGTMWSHSYDLHLQPYGGGIRINNDGTGRRDLYQLQTNGTFTCPEFFREGTLSNNVFKLTFADTGYWEFKPLTASADAGKLAKIVNRNGNTMLLHYNGAGQLIQVVDDLDRTNTIAYNTDGRVAVVTDCFGRTVSYQYYRGLPGEPGGAGDLAAVTSTPVIGTPNGNDFPTGKTTTYTYSKGYLDDRENHLMLTARDALGQIKYEHVYQHNQSDLDFIRCISFQRWTNPPTILTYLPQTAAPSNQFATLRCIVNAPGGEVSEHFFDARNRCVRLGEFTGYATPGVAVTDTVNRPTNKRRQEDSDVWWRTWTWNNDSLCTSETSPDGAHTRMIYRQDFGPTQPQKKGDLMIVHESPCCNGADTDGDGVLDLTKREWRYEYDPRFGSPLMTARFPAKTCKYWAAVSFERSGAHGRTGGTDWHPKDWWQNKGWDGFVTSVTDPRGHVTAATYDNHGNLTRIVPFIVDRDPPVLDFAYNSHGELIGVTNAPDANGQRRADEYVRNYGFKVECIIDVGPGGLRLTNKFERDLRGNITRYVNARGHDWLYTWNARDQLMRVETPTNIVSRSATSFRYDANDNPIEVATEVRDRNDNFQHHSLGTCEWQDIRLPSRIVTQVSTNQFCTNEFVYNANGQCVLIRGGDAVSGADPHHTISMQYDERRLVFRETAAADSTAQSTTQFDYDSNGNPIRVSDGLEGTPSVTTMEYDGFASFRWTPLVPKPRDPVTYSSARKAKAWMVNNFEVHPVFLTAWVETVWNKQCVEKDTTVRLAAMTDPMGNVTTLNYDATDNLKVVRRFGQMNEAPGTNGNIRLAECRYEYDVLNLLTRSRDLFFNPVTQAPISDGERTTTFGYAPNGQCTSVTDDLDRKTTFGYNPIGWSIATTNAKYEVKLAYHDVLGNPTGLMIIDRPDLGGPPQVFARTNVFDSLNRCVSTTDNVGNNESWSFDSLSRVVMATDPRGIHSFFEYDLLGRQTLAIRDLNGNGVPELSTDYSERATWSTSNGRLLATTDSHDNVTSYAHDSQGRVTQITHADGTHRSLVWSPRSNLTSEQDANGTVAFHTYDLNNRCISNSYTPGPTVATTTTFETFAYDGCSRLVGATNNVSHSGWEYDSLGNNYGNHQDGWALLQADSSMGFCTSLTYPGGRTLTFAYDAINQCTNVAESGASLMNLSYAGPGRPARVNYGNGTRAQITYNGYEGAANPTDDFGHGEISSITHGIAGTQTRIAAVNLKWDRNANKTTRTETIFAGTTPRTNELALAYNAADQLTEAILHSGSSLLRDTLYGLDRMGNRTNVTGAAICSGPYFMQAFTPGPMDFQMNQYTATPCDSRTYDERGNLVGRGAGPGSFVSYSYDCHNRLVSVNDSGNPIATYSYNALGQRISKTVFGSSGLPPVTTEYIYHGNSVIEERENGAVTATYLRLGVANNGVERAGFGSMRRNGQDYYFHPDDQGNVLALSTTGGAIAERYEHDDYGKVTFLTSDGFPTTATSSTVGNPYCWNGLRLDAETGLQNNDGGGYFEPQTGRFTTKGYTVNARSETYLGYDRDRVNPWSGGGIGSSGGGVFSTKTRPELKAEFQNGDIPDQNDFADTIDSALNLMDDGLTSYGAKIPRPVLKEYFQSGDKPTQAQFGAMLDSLLNYADDRYLLGLRNYDTRSCPEGAVCPGGGRVWPRPGYWSAAKASKDMVVKGKKILQN